MNGADGMETVLGKALHAAVCGDPEVCCWTEEGGTCESNTPLGIEAHLAQALRDAGYGDVAAEKAEALEVVRRVEADMSEQALLAWRSADARRGLRDHAALEVHADALTRWSERLRMAFNGEYYRADQIEADR